MRSRTSKSCRFGFRRFGLLIGNWDSRLDIWVVWLKVVDSSVDEDSMSLCFRDSTLMNLFCSKILLIIFYDIILFILKILAIYTVLLWYSKVFSFVVGSARALARRAAYHFMKWSSRQAACNIYQKSNSQILKLIIL